MNKTPVSARFAGEGVPSAHLMKGLKTEKWEAESDMRPIWKGTISFGMVSILDSLYLPTLREELKFRLLRASDLSPINYMRVAETDGKEVP